MIFAILLTVWTSSLSLAFATNSLAFPSGAASCRVRDFTASLTPLENRRSASCYSRFDSLRSAALLDEKYPIHIPRGGVSLLAAGNDAKTGASTNTNAKKVARIVLFGILAIAAVWKREFFLNILPSRSDIVARLDDLNELGTQGLVLYTIAFALWEIFIGVTTPVETAAGMAFGVKKGIIASSIGKMGGAIVAFLVGRYLLFSFVSEKLEDNEMMDLVQESIKEQPVRVALVWRFSFLPEQVKTFGLSVLPLSLRHFIMAVVLHGFPFTVLWSCMGAEAGALARGTISSPSALFKVLVVGVYIFGFFVSPSMVALWVKSLKDKQKGRKRE